MGPFSAQGFLADAGIWARDATSYASNELQYCYCTLAVYTHSPFSDYFGLNETILSVITTD